MKIGHIVLSLTLLPLGLLAMPHSSWSLEKVRLGYAESAPVRRSITLPKKSVCSTKPVWMLRSFTFLVDQPSCRR
jgi:hypothetical protein